MTRERVKKELRAALYDSRLGNCGSERVKNESCIL